MNNKKAIIEAVMPIAVLQPQAPEALEAVPQSSILNGLVCIRLLPFRVGRESRVHLVNDRMEIMERQKGNSGTPNNDLYLVDRGQLLNISREHFSIDIKNGIYMITDRGSACGTIVNNNIVGGQDNRESIELTDGAIISVGSQNSKYIYKFIILN